MRPRNGASVRAWKRIFRTLHLQARSVPHHCGAEEAENLADRIRNRAGAAARVEQTHRARIRRHVFDHQRS